MSPHLVSGAFLPTQDSEVSRENVSRELLAVKLLLQTLTCGVNISENFSHCILFGFTLVL